MHVDPLPPILNALGGGLVAALGIWVATMRPRSSAGLALALFCTGFGGFFILNNGAGPLHISRGWGITLALMAGYAAWAAGLIAMAVAFPRPLSGRERPLAAVAGLALLGAGLLIAWSGSGLTPPPGPWGEVYVRLGGFANAALYCYLLLLTLRFAREPGEAARRQLALTATGLLAYSGVVAGAGAGPGSSPLHLPFALNWPWVRLGLVVLIAFLWLRAASGPSPRLARNVGLLALALPLYGMAWEAGWVWGNSGVNRTLMVAILVYAILRHQLLGLDVKVRWGISRGTVGAAFVAAFFLAGEGAQLLFGAEDQWIGLLAAGALVFALAPLQRAADRLAERAVPTAAPVPQDSEEPYRAAVRLALRDRVLTREEERTLLLLAERAGIPASRALAIHAEAERERARPP